MSASTPSPLNVVPQISIPKHARDRLLSYVPSQKLRAEAEVSRDLERAIGDALHAAEIFYDTTERRKIWLVELTGHYGAEVFALLDEDKDGSGRRVAVTVLTGAMVQRSKANGQFQPYTGQGLGTLGDTKSGEKLAALKAETPKRLPGESVTDAELKRLYEDEELSCARIGERVGLSGDRVRYRLSKAGVTLRPATHAVANRQPPATKKPVPVAVDPHARRLVTFVKAGKAETQSTTAGEVAKEIESLVLGGAAPSSIEVWKPLRVRVQVSVEEV